MKHSKLGRCFTDRNQWQSYCPFLNIAFNWRLKTYILVFQDLFAKVACSSYCWCYIYILPQTRYIKFSSQNSFGRSRFTLKSRSSHVILKIASTPWRVLCTFNPLPNERSTTGHSQIIVSTRSSTQLIVKVAFPSGHHKFVCSLSL